MGDLDLNFFDHLVMFVIAIVMPGLAIMSSRQSLSDLEITPKIKKTIYWTNSLFLWFGLIVVITVWIMSGRSWSVLGIQKPVDNASKLWLVLLVVFVVLYFIDLLSNLVNISRRQATVNKWEKHTPFMPVNWNEFLWFLLVAVSAGICEEVIYRGYMINYLFSALKHSSEAVVYSVMIPAVIFGVAHIYQGRKAVLKVVLMAMIFGYIFVLTQSILLLIIMHILVDVIGGLIGIFLIPKSAKPTEYGSEEE